MLLRSLRLASHRPRLLVAAAAASDAEGGAAAAAPGGSLGALMGCLLRLRAALLRAAGSREVLAVNPAPLARAIARVEAAVDGEGEGEGEGGEEEEEEDARRSA
jgi:hypothetical protein